ncbi:MAG: xanthine dehydrogenase family protein molybdopterin-binding subunit [Nitrososphaerales archaeon]
MTEALLSKEIPVPRKWVGTPIKAKEFPRLITGQGRYVDDIKIPNMLYAALLRSPYAHAKIKRIDTSKAEKLPGVVAIVTQEDVLKYCKPYPQIVPPPADKLLDYCIAVDKVRFAGEPVAAVAATERAIAEDACELIEVEYEPLPPVMDAEEALKPDAPLVHEEVGTNLVWHEVFDYGDVDKAFAEADKVISLKLHHHRYGGAPTETHAVVADYDKGTGVLTIYCNNQMPMFCMALIGLSFNMPTDKIRIITPDIGGGFGSKILSYTYMMLISILAMKAGRPVKWMEDRRENLASGTHCNEATFYVEAAVKKDGTILGIKAKTLHDVGAYLRYEPVGALLWIQVSSGPYRFKNLRMDVNAIVTNKGPVAPIRGYGRIQHLWMLERTVEQVARQLGLDPIEVKLKNYVRPEEMPYVSPSGATYDSGDYPTALKKALQMINYDEWRRKQPELWRQGRFVGIGAALFQDSGTNNFAQVRLIYKNNPFSGNSRMAEMWMDEFGRIIVAVGSNPHGQCHETVVSQVVADVFGVTPDDVFVVPGFDSWVHGWTGHSGSYASQFAVSGIGAVLGAAKRLREKIATIAAHMLKAKPEDLEFKEGKVCVKGTDRCVAFWQVANLAYRNNLELPEGVEPGLRVIYTWKAPFKLPDLEKKTVNATLTYSYQAHACVVEVDPETGKVKILDYAVVDDCGVPINPHIVEGQVHGSTMNGIAAALFEEYVYSKDTGQLLASTFMDYLFPTALEIPDIKVDHMISPSPFTELGTKGVGEGSLVPLGSIAGAIEDALSPLGVVITDSHNPPERIYRMIKEAQKKRK